VIVHVSSTCSDVSLQTPQTSDDVVRFIRPGLATELLAESGISVAVFSSLQCYFISSQSVSRRRYLKPD
jgi:hypothetical protein